MDGWNTLEYYFPIGARPIFKNIASFKEGNRDPVKFKEGNRDPIIRTQKLPGKTHLYVIIIDY